MADNIPTLFRTEALVKLAEELSNLSSRISNIEGESSEIKTYTVESGEKIPNKGLTYYLNNACLSFRMTVNGSRCLLIDTFFGADYNLTRHSSQLYLFSSSIGCDWVSTSNKHIIDKVYQHRDETDSQLICYTLCIDSSGVYLEIENIKDSSSELTYSFSDDTHFSGIVNLAEDETFTNGIEHKGEAEDDGTTDEDPTDTTYYTGLIRKGSSGFYTIDLTAIDGFDYTKYDNLIGYHYIAASSGNLGEHSAGGTYLKITDGTLYVAVSSDSNYTGSDYENNYHFLVYATSSTSDISCFIMGRFVNGDTCYACSGSAFRNMCPLSVAYGYDPKYIPFTLDTWNASADTTKTYPSIIVSKVNDAGDMSFDLSTTADYGDYTGTKFYHITSWGSSREWSGTGNLQQTGSVIKIRTTVMAAAEYPDNYHVLLQITKDDSTAWVVFRDVDGDTGYILTDDELNNDYPLCVKDGYNPLDIDYPIKSD